MAEEPDGRARLLRVTGPPTCVWIGGVGLGGMGLGMAGLLVLLASGPLWATLACSRPLLWIAGLVTLAAVDGCWAGWRRPLLAIGGPLALLDALGGGAGLVPGGSLGRLARYRAERLLGVADPIGAAVVLDGGRGLPPRPAGSGGVRDRAEFLAEVAGWGVLGGQTGGAALPGQLPHDVAVDGAEVGVGLQPPGPALLGAAAGPGPGARDG
jgi:hypothetical protein